VRDLSSAHRANDLGEMGHKSVLLIKRVNVFASVLIKEIGLQFFSSDKSPFFGSRHIQVVISGAKDEGYNLKYNNKRIDSKWNQLS
jgi:hypothetical protein